MSILFLAGEKALGDSEGACLEGRHRVPSQSREGGAAARPFTALKSQGPS